MAVVLVITLGGAATMLPMAAAQGRTVLVVAQSGDVDSLDNEKALGPSKNAIILCTDWQYIGYKPIQLKSGPMSVDVTKFVPRIVERWEDRPLPDGKHQYTLYVKRGLLHHSGNPVVAQDIAFSFQRRQAFRRDTLERTVGYFKADRDIEVVDDYTIRFTTERYSPLFYNILTQRNLYDSRRTKELAGSRDPWGEEYLKRNCVAGGPYKLARWNPGVEMVFDRWPEWWGNRTWEKTSADQVVLRIVPSVETRVLLLQRGQIDFAMDLPAKEINRLRNAPGIKVMSYPSLNQLYVGINPSIKPFDNVKVRRAMAHAFPYEAAIREVYGGEARRLNGPLPTGVLLARKVPAYSTDLNKAKALLAEAGFPNGFETTLVFDAKFQAHEDLAVLYKANLEKIGVRANIQAMPSPQFNTETRAKKIGLFFYEGLWWIADPLYMLNLSFYSAAHTNVSNYQNPRVDEMLDQANLTVDTKARLKILEQVQNFIIDDVAWIFVAQPNFNIAVRSNIEGYVHQNTELHHLWLLRKGK